MLTSCIPWPLQEGSHPAFPGLYSQAHILHSLASTCRLTYCIPWPLQECSHPAFPGLYRKAHILHSLGSTGRLTSYIPWPVVSKCFLYQNISKRMSLVNIIWYSNIYCLQVCWIQVTLSNFKCCISEWLVPGWEWCSSLYSAAGHLLLQSKCHIWLSSLVVCYVMFYIMYFLNLYLVSFRNLMSFGKVCRSATIADIFTTHVLGF